MLFNESFRNAGKPFSPLHINIRSVKNKTGDLELFFNSLCTQFDVILLTETWLTKNDDAPNFRNYKCERLNRNDERGGIAIYFRQNLPFYTIDKFSTVNPNVDSLLVCLDKTLIAVGYRPPSGDKGVFLFLYYMLRFVGSASLNCTAQYNSKETEPLRNTW